MSLCLASCPPPWFSRIQLLCATCHGRPVTNFRFLCLTILNMVHLWQTKFCISMFNHNMVQQWQTLKFYSSMFNHNMVLTWFNLWQTAIIARNIKPKGPLGACAPHVFSPQTMFATNIVCDCYTCIHFIDTYSSKLY